MSVSVGGGAREGGTVRGLVGLCSPVQLLSFLQFFLSMLLEHVQGIVSCQACWGDIKMIDTQFCVVLCSSLHVLFFLLLRAQVLSPALFSVSRCASLCPWPRHTHPTFANLAFLVSLISALIPCPETKTSCLSPFLVP